jgi:hypothetical protein
MFRFTIRDLLWLTVVVALGVGWWVERYRAAIAATKWEEAVTRMVSDLCEATGHDVSIRTPDGKLIFCEHHHGPASPVQDGGMVRGSLAPSPSLPKN